MAEHDSDFSSPEAMRGWLEREIADIRRAAELRIKDATRFVSAYASGEISAQEVENHSLAYEDRWGDVLPGVMRTQGLSDEEILARLDKARQATFAGRSTPSLSRRTRNR
jgi:hypothetical protein